MTNTRIIHTFPALPKEPSPVLMILGKVSVVLAAVCAGHGVASLWATGSGARPSDAMTLLVAGAIAIIFFIVRLRMVARYEASLEIIRDYVCKGIKGTVAIDSEELRLAINGETVVTGAGDTISVNRDGTDMNVVLHDEATK